MSDSTIPPTEKDARQLIKELNGLESHLKSGNLAIAAKSAEKAFKTAVAIHQGATAASDPAATARLLSDQFKNLHIPLPRSEDQAKLLKSLRAAEGKIAETTLALAASNDPVAAIALAAKIIESTLNMAFEMVDALPEDTKTITRNRLKKPYTELIDRIDQLKDDIGPLRKPLYTFNPAGFHVIAHVMATALMAQNERKLSNLPREMGSGIYALFYRGDLPFYALLKSLDVPVYVGSASPDYDGNASGNDEKSLAGRIGEHYGSIKEVEAAISKPAIEMATKTPRVGNLSINDFEYRILAVTPGWELAAEQYLIRFYRPVWNKETKRPKITGRKAGTLCTGFGKHGDASSTRSNKRSQWDTLHPGRTWAYDDKAKNNDDSAEAIQQDIVEHLKIHGSHKLSITTLIGAATGHPDQEPDLATEETDSGDKI
jgi:hypothetical protein